MSNKKMNGQFFTITNPFLHDLFYKWTKIIQNFDKCVILEPFAGSNNIVDMVRSIGFNNNWSCYDIDPPEINNYPEFPVKKMDVITKFPIDKCNGGGGYSSYNKSSISSKKLCIER